MMDTHEGTTLVTFEAHALILKEQHDWQPAFLCALPVVTVPDWSTPK